METTQIQSEIEITIGQNVSSQTFGDGRVTAVNGDIVTATFKDGEHKVKDWSLTEAESLDELKARFVNCWSRGEGWRLEIGEVLSKIKDRCSYGEWGAFLDEHDLARASADTYVRKYRDALGIALPEQFGEPNPESTPDGEAADRAARISQEQARREGKKPTHHQSELRVTVKGLSADQIALYHEERKADPTRVARILQAAVMQVISVLPEEGEVTSYTATGDDLPVEITNVVLTAEAECSAS